MSKPKLRRLCKVGLQVQSVLIDRKLSSRKSAEKWLRLHGFKRTLDVKPNTFRARQKSPKKFVKGMFRTITIKPGIKAVVGCPK